MVIVPFVSSWVASKEFMACNFTEIFAEGPFEIGPLPFRGKEEVCLHSTFQDFTCWLILGHCCCSFTTVWDEIPSSNETSSIPQ